MQPLYIQNNDLNSLSQKYMPFKICSAAESIVKGQISGSFLIDNVWHIYPTNITARNIMLKHGNLEINKQKIELYTEHPAITYNPPSEKIVLRNVPPSIYNEDILRFLNGQPGIVVKSKVISGKIRNQQNELTEYYSGERIVYVKGSFSPALPMYADFGKHRTRVWHASQYDACKRCRHLDHNHLETDKCDAFMQEDDDAIAFRSPNYVLCNFYVNSLFVYDRHFTSVEQAYQWKKMKHIKQEAFALEITKAKTPSKAKQIANRVPQNLLEDWHFIKLDVMKQILDAKLEQCSKFRDELSKSQGKRIIEATQDTYWASGLPPYLSTTTKPEYFPGENWLGRILEDMREELIRSSQSSSTKLATNNSTAGLLQKSPCVPTHDRAPAPDLGTASEAEANLPPDTITNAFIQSTTPNPQPVAMESDVPPVHTDELPPESTADSPPEFSTNSAPESTAPPPPESTADSLSESTADSPPEFTTNSAPESTAAPPPESTADSHHESSAGSPLESAADSPPESTADSPPVEAMDKPLVHIADTQPVTTTIEPFVVTPTSTTIDSTKMILSPDQLVIPPPSVPSNINIESPTRTEKELKIIESDIELFPKLLIPVKDNHQQKRRARSILRDQDRVRSMSARPIGHDMHRIDSFFIRKRKAIDIATSPTSPDHGPADKVVRCLNATEIFNDEESTTLSRSSSKPARLDMENAQTDLDAPGHDKPDSSDVGPASVEDDAMS